MSKLCVCGRCTGDILHAPDCGHFIDGRCSCGGTRLWLAKQREEIDRLYGPAPGWSRAGLDTGSASGAGIEPAPLRSANALSN